MMSDQNNALIVGIAQIIDYPSVYMGGPSRNSMRIAETIVKEFGTDLARADRAAPEGQPVTLTYTNWRGETAERTITPKRIWFGSTDWHPEPQWLLTAFDAEKQADRDFALKDFGQVPPPAAPEGQVRVKPITFNNRGSEWWGNSPFGIYVVARVQCDATEYWTFWQPDADSDDTDAATGHYASEKDALSAAQADYESRILAALTTPPAAPEGQPVTQEPVAWRCKDYADDWIIYRNKSDADQYQAVTGCLMQPLYAAPQPASQKEAVAVAEVLTEARAGLCAHAGGPDGACAETIKRIDAALRALKGGS